MDGLYAQALAALQLPPLQEQEMELQMRDEGPDGGGGSDGSDEEEEEGGKAQATATATAMPPVGYQARFEAAARGVGPYLGVRVFCLFVDVF